MTLALIVALALAGLGVYVAYKNPPLGVALLVGLAILTALYLVWENDPTVFGTETPLPTHTHVGTPPETPSATSPPASPTATSPPGGPMPSPPSPPSRE